METIRIAAAVDAEEMLQIYSPFILNSGITQETELPSVSDFGHRIISTLRERPWLLCEIDGVMAGYAYAAKHRERAGYRWCIEPSVYIHEKFYGYGVGHALYKALFGILKLQGFVNAYAVITLPNERSVAFHEKFGFTYLTTYKKIGYKLGRWHDVGWWEYQINPPSAEMRDPVKFPELPSFRVEEINRQATGWVVKK